MGSFAYNVTMTLGAAALVHPLVLQDVNRLHLPLIAMLGALAVVICLAMPRKILARKSAVALLSLYAVFIFLVLRH